MFEHISVLLNEAVNGLNIKSDGIYVDCTLGAGGHSAEILKRIDSGHLYCFDQDEEAIQVASERLQAISDHFTIIHTNFKNIKSVLYAQGIEHVDGILFDLGVSSPQFDEGYRGFSYNYDAKLDMRMDTSQSLSAYEIVNTYSYEQLLKILYQYGDEKYAKNIARNIEHSRNIKPIETTFELVDIIKQSIPAAAKRKSGHPAKKTFQAIRIAVNDELHVFEEALHDSLDLLNVNGRIVVITFHSLEDKICKYTFNEVSTTPKLPQGMPIVPDNLKPKFQKITKKPIVASDEELNRNHRAHSAKLRIIERIEKDEKN
ncbi:MAG: 16S rRNA (cytosine(1402)-N(4))-methyltransferase RsmH [Erysipelotrichaceae bacterium]|nr:16S rRNA (cytosine(1402)-N(4))-methyltransferase RsmH [Erysipelotrichaceae bacterium]